MAAGSFFEQLVRDHHAAVFRTARRIVRDDHAAMDVAQQVFVKALDATGRLARAEHPERILRWLAQRTALSHLRSTHSRGERERKVAMESDAVQPPAEVGGHEERSRLAALMAALPDELRVAVVLRFQEDLSFEEIAELCACSRATAHHRVGRALDRLRHGLIGAGCALLAGDLEAQLARPVPIAVPPLLEARLLAIGAQAAALPSGLAVAVLVLAMAGAVAVGTRQRWLPERLLTQAQPASVPAQVPAPRPPVAVPLPRSERVPQPRGAAVDGAVAMDDADAPAAAADPVVRRIAGRLVDADDQPIAGGEVLAESVARDGKAARAGGRAISAADGSYSLEVVVDPLEGTWFRLQARRAGETLLAGVEVQVAADADSHLDLRAEVVVDERPGDYRLELVLKNADGQPVADAEVSVLRLVRGLRGQDGAVFEAAGRSDVDGRAHVEGGMLGRKRIDVRAKGAAPREAELVITAPGHQQREVRLLPAPAIAGRLRMLEGALPPEARVFAYDRERADDWRFGEIAGDGSFRIDGLRGAACVVRAEAPDCAPITLTDIAAGRSDLELVFKRLDDVSDRGSHRAEIHGWVRLRQSGAPVAVSFADLELEVLEVPADLDDLAFRQDFLPNHLFPPSRQIMVGPHSPPRSDAFHFVDLPAGRYALRLCMPRQAVALAGPFDLGPATIVRDVLLRVGAGAAIAGQVLDASGRPIVGAVAIITGSGPLSSAALATADDLVQKAGGAGSFYFPSARSDEQGRFQFDRLPDGLPLRIGVLHPAFAPTVTASLELRDGETRAAVVTLREPRVR